MPQPVDRRKTALSADETHQLLSISAREVYDDGRRMRPLDRLLFRDHESAASPTRSAPFPTSDWHHVHRELRRKGVTLMLLWHEYKAEHPHGYRYSRFCDLYRTWRGRLDLIMRHDHKAGEKLFVDYDGQTVLMRYPSGAGQPQERRHQGPPLRAGRQPDLSGPGRAFTVWLSGAQQ